jgi:hypothetical protein
MHDIRDFDATLVRRLTALNLKRPLVTALQGGFEMRNTTTNEPRQPGISNRETAEEEQKERHDTPPLDTGSPEPEDAAGRVGENPLDDQRDRHTSHKAGSRSVAQKEAGSRYPDRSMPASHKVAGAYGREPDAPSERDRAGSAKPRGNASR